MDSPVHSSDLNLPPLAELNQQDDDVVVIWQGVQVTRHTLHSNEYSSFSVREFNLNRCFLLQTMGLDKHVYTYLFE